LIATSVACGSDERPPPAAEATRAPAKSPGETADVVCVVSHRTTTEATARASAYLSAKVVPAASRVDALHVALASVANADTVVS
jgi:hypothetical protein